MREEGISVALLQEPYVMNGCVCGLPSDMIVIMSGVDAKAAVVVNDKNMEVVAVDEYVNEHGVCAWIKSKCGVFYVCTVYCQYSLAIEPMVQFMESVMNLVGGEPVIFGFDANAMSPMWHSKYTGCSRSVEERGMRTFC